MTLSISTPILQQLAEYAHQIRLNNVPAEVAHQTQLNILDTIGCIVSGSKLPDAHTFMQAELARGGHREASVIGYSQKISIESAARINAYMGDMFELNDLIGGHASIAVVPAALALAESIGASGAQLIEAIVAGTEVLCRIHGGFYAHQKPFTETAMVQVTLSSACGAAVAASKLLGLNQEQTLHAMAIAGALTSWCPAELIFGEGSSIKPVLFGGWPGATGLQAAHYAKMGLKGATRLLESPIGYYTTVARTYDLKIILDFDTWRLASPRRKLHACCGYMHSAIDTLAKLRNQGLLNNTQKYRIYLPAYIIPAVSKKGQTPKDGNEARFNIEYCLALAAMEADVITPEHSLECLTIASRPEIFELMKFFEVIEEPQFGHYRFSRVEVLGADGKLITSVENDAPRGTEWNPMTDDEVINKFKQLTRHARKPDQIQNYLQKFETLPQQKTIEWLLQSL